MKIALDANIAPELRDAIAALDSFLLPVLEAAPEKIGEEFISLFDRFLELGRAFDLDSTTASTADKILILVKPSAALEGLVAAVRASDGDLGVINDFLRGHTNSPVLGEAKHQPA